MTTISAIINTLNEEAHITECIRSVKDFADEVVVCDMNSTDKTVELAQAAGAKVCMVDATFADFGRLRYAAISQAYGDWILVIDADERLTPALAHELKEIAIQDRSDVVFFYSLPFYFGGWLRHGIFFHNNWRRFFKRSVYLDNYVEYDEQIHKDLAMLFNPKLRHIRLSKKVYLLHYAYPTIEKYITKSLSRYAQLEAKQRFKRGARFSFWRMIGEPLRYFTESFILRQGFRDGMRGFIAATLFAAYRFIAWADLWLLEDSARKKNERVGNDLSESSSQT